ncbi:DUF7511 domain-containing protein [Natrinema limicola]|uniref:DUF7511 domain-containing protein n=1 Tax=Natrinema limicola TaxID=370323 RepID=UPI0012676A28|nr:hypothetical protein [Natrinema limicola]
MLVYVLVELIVWDRFEIAVGFDCPRACLEERLEHVVVAYDDRPDELGVVPHDTDSDELASWVTIETDVTLGLENWR